MRTVKVVESVDINAPREDVFAIITNCDRRLQLSPLWGVIEIKEISADFPREGSRYHAKKVHDEEEYDTIVTSFIPCQKFAYQLMTGRGISVVWTFQEVAQGTRLMYYEEFLVDAAGDDEFVKSVRATVRQWLKNIKLYAELRGGWLQRQVKWLADHYLLKLRADQRRIILAILVMQGIGCLTFIAAAIGLGIAGLVM